MDENPGLIRETVSRAQGKNQTGTRASLELLYHISREIATTINLPTLIERILVLSVENIGAQNGSIFVVDEAGNPVISTLIIHGKLLPISTERIQATLDKGLAGWVMRNQEAVLIANTSKDSRWLHRPDDAKEASGAKSAISVPFLARDQVVGVITLVHTQPNFFQEDHRALIQAIADQSAVAVLNARFHADTLRKARVMTALAESATAITRSLHLQDVLQCILEQISLAFSTEAVSLGLINEDKRSLTIYASTSEVDYRPVGMKINYGEGIPGWVAAHGTAYTVPNTFEDEAFSPDFDQEAGFKAEVVACVPIFSEGEIIGVVEAVNPKMGRFEADALHVLQGISSLAGTAIRHAQLYEILQETHKRYYDLFEGSISSILLTDLAGKILEVNQQTATLSKYSKKELDGLQIACLHKPDWEALGEDFESLCDEKTISYESILITKTKTEIPVRVNVQPVLVRGTSYLQWDLHDISERKALELLREDLISMIYHDLRSPLGNVLASLDLITNLLNFEKESPEIRNLFDIAMRSTNRIQRLTASLLDINRLEAGQAVLDLAPARIEALLDSCLEELKPILVNKKIDIHVETDQTMPEVMINIEMMGRVVINLIENAIKYTPQAGEIRVGAQLDGGEIRIWVEDNGPGIPEEHLQRIFEKYTRLPAKEKRKGYGLGLAFCRLAVAGHGGKIWAETIDKGGARFTFTLPIQV